MKGPRTNGFVSITDATIEKLHALPLSAIRIYFRLAQHIDSDCYCYPSQERLAELAGVRGQSHVARAINQLVAIGLVVKKGTRTRRAYLILGLRLAGDRHATGGMPSMPPEA